MFRIVLAALALGLCTVAAAQITTYADVKAKNGVQLSTAELKQLKIPWPRSPDDWCFYMFKVGDKYYGVSRLEDGATAMEFEFSR
jgi:hypothetical protein